MIRKRPEKPCGRRGHPVFTDAEVELVLQLADAGLTYQQIAEKWDAGKPMSKSQVAKIVQGRGRVYPSMPLRPQ